MKSRFGLVALLLAIACFLPAPLLAQYMYLDSNGDGVWTVADALLANGTPTVADVYLDTDSNRDGTTATCNISNAPLDINSYIFNLRAVGGVVSYTSAINRIPEFTIAMVPNGFVSDETDCTIGWGTHLRLPPGRYRLATVTITGLAGSPYISIVPMISVNFTGFGTSCEGNDFDNTYKLGTDWFDWDGLGVCCSGAGAPFLDPIANMTVLEGQTATQEIRAHDPDGSPIQFQKVTGPPFMFVTTTDPLGGVGSIALSPGFADAGTGIPASVRATDGVLLSNTRSFQITVVPVNRAPVADAGGPYTGVPGVSITFDGTGSSDPDGDPLTFFWAFGDQSSGVGANPTHTYAQPGTYGVALSVSDGVNTSLASTLATITDLFQARAFTTRANRLLRLGSGKPHWSISIEPIGQSFAVDQVNPSSVRLRSSGTGTVSEIRLAPGKTLNIADADGNGIVDLELVFAKSDLQALFSNLSGSTSASVTIEGTLFGGGVFRAQTDIGVLASHGGTNARILPNPLNPAGTLELSTSRAGRVRAELFDVSGRLVRVLADRSVAAGWQELRIEARTSEGTPLASGLYYVRVSTPDGVSTLRVAVLK